MMMMLHYDLMTLSPEACLHFCCTQDRSAPGDRVTSRRILRESSQMVKSRALLQRWCHPACRDYSYRDNTPVWELQHGVAEKNNDERVTPQHSGRNTIAHTMMKLVSTVSMTSLLVLVDIQLVPRGRKHVTARPTKTDNASSRCTQMTVSQCAPWSASVRAII